MFLFNSLDATGGRLVSAPDITLKPAGETSKYK
jgi:hypothetical protein